MFKNISLQGIMCIMWFIISLTFFKIIAEHYHFSTVLAPQWFTLAYYLSIASTVICVLFSWATLMIWNDISDDGKKTKIKIYHDIGDSNINVLFVLSSMVYTFIAFQFGLYGYSFIYVAHFVLSFMTYSFFASIIKHVKIVNLKEEIRKGNNDE